MAALTAAQLKLIRLEIADSPQEERAGERQFDDDMIQAVYDDAGESIGKTVIALIEAQIAIAGVERDFESGVLKIRAGNRLNGLRLLLATKRNKYREYPAEVIDD